MFNSFVRMFYIYYEYGFVFVFKYFSTGLLNLVRWAVKFYKIW